MGLRGPTRRPNFLKVISGTDRPGRMNELAPAAADVVLVDAPAVPDWMPNGEARAEWVRVCALLVDRGTLDPLKLGPLSVYCATHGKIQQAFRAGTMRSAHLQSQYRSMAKELGISDTTKPLTDAGGGAKAGGRWAGIKARAQSKPE